MTATWQYVDDEAPAKAGPRNCAHIEYYKSPDEKPSTSGERQLHALFSLVVAFPLWGWMLSLMWAWFIAPPFGLPLITVWQSIGIVWTIALVRYKIGTRHVTSSELGQRTTEDLVLPFVAIAFAWPFAHFVLGTV
jgi:hypothetical protein